ncbi:MAG TPA: hypothetical protein VM734_27590 [Kofleriaceae bacterium]|nr:hypothetical protein [Kofleriaceae bacterium]
MKLVIRSIVVGALGVAACGGGGESDQPKSVTAEYDAYMLKSKSVEAQLRLNSLKNSLKATLFEKDGFPVGTVPATPAKPCCASGGKCAPDPAAWAAEVWQALDFTMDDPHYFQYAYTSDGRTVRVTAVGDLDCDGTTIEYVLEGTAAGGEPTFTLTEPAKLD